MARPCALRGSAGALLAALLCALAHTAAADGGCAKTVATWAPCGGSYACPCGTTNCDLPWPRQCCGAGDACVRQNPSWWRCEPRKEACAYSVDDWAACGGSYSCPPSQQGDCDRPWTTGCCRAGSQCARQDGSWWRCEPADWYSGDRACPNAVATWRSCGGAADCPQDVANCAEKWPGYCCAAAADACVRKDDRWWRCEPKEGAPQQQQAPPRGSPPPALALNGSAVVERDSGAPAVIHGLNWFGYNTGTTMVDGLWVGGSEAATDFAAIAYQLSALGYNTVRLPFRWQDLDARPKDQSRACTPVRASELRERLLEPGRWTAAELPRNPAPIKNYWANTCNTYLPSTSTVDRLLWTVQVLVAQGLYVVLDYQPMGSEYQAHDVPEFACKWRSLWSRVAALPAFDGALRGRIFVDLMNEPDSMSIRWEPSNGRPGAADLYLAAMDAVVAVTPDALFFAEGTGQNNYGLNWGNGFVTDPGLIARYRLSDANAFLGRLTAKPYAGQVVLTPHVYPPSITGATFLGTALWQQCRNAFGYLATDGYCPPGAGGAAGSGGGGGGGANSNRCRRFPVVVGETGSSMHDALDVAWLNDFSDFVAARGGAAAYTRAPLSGWLWWSYNENSGDTGGIVWQKINWQKVRFMAERLGLQPWYLAPPPLSLAAKWS